MNEQRRIRFFLGIIVALVALNIGLLAWIWVRPAATSEHRRTRSSTAGTFLADTLGFTPQQRQQLALLQKAYFRQVEPRRKPLKQARKAYFHLLDSSLTDAHRRELVLAFHQQAADADLITLTHFDRVAAICTPGQRKLLNNLLGELPGRAFRMPRSMRAGMAADSTR